MNPKHKKAAGAEGANFARVMVISWRDALVMGGRFARVAHHPPRCSGFHLTNMKTSFPSISKGLGLCILSQAALVGGSQAATKVWAGATSGNWTTGASWTGGLAPVSSLTTDTVRFDDSTILTTVAVNVNSARSIAGLAFPVTTASVTFSGNSLTVGASGITNAGNLGHNFLNQVILGANRTVDSGSGSFLFQAPTIFSGLGGLTKQGSGGIYLSGVGSHTGDTILSAGLIQLQHFNALKDSTLDTGSSGTRSLVFQQSAVEDETDGINDGVDVAFGTYHLGGLKGGLTFAVNSTDDVDGLVGARSLSVGSNGTSNVFSGSITGDGSFTKVGAGMQTFSGNNAYTGFTKVAEGELRINGSTAGGSVVSVLDQATLSGIGTVGGDTTIESGGTLAVGQSPGLLTFSNDLTQTTGSIFEWELDSKVSTQSGGSLPGEGTVTAGTGVRGTDFDAADVDGDVTIASGAIFKIMLTDFFDRATDTFWDTRQVWSVFDAAGTKTGVFDTFEIWEDSAGTPTQLTANSVKPGYFSFAWGTDGLGANSGNLIWTPIPEPGNALVGLILGAGLLKRRRKLVTA